MAYGDSFVMGGGLLPENKVFPNSWPQLLGKKLGVPAVNRGVGGGSNKLAILNLLEDLPELLQKDVLVVFSWTGIQRTVWFDPDTEVWVNYLIGHVPPSKELQKRYKFYFESFYSDTDAILTLYSQQLFLPKFLDSMGIPYFFINSFNDMDQFIHYRHHYPHIFNSIDKSKYMLGYDDSIYHRICQKFGRICEDKFHPSEVGHDILATMMVDYIKDNNIIKI